MYNVEYHKILCIDEHNSLHRMILKISSTNLTEIMHKYTYNVLSPISYKHA